MSAGVHLRLVFGVIAGLSAAVLAGAGWRSISKRVPR
jgi:hypothetical protein